MAKKNTSQFNTILLIILVIIGIYLVANLSVIQNLFQEGFTFAWPDKDIEDKDKPCEEYHVYNEYVDTFGQTNIDRLESACKSVNPNGFTGDKAELGCYINGFANFICPNTAGWDTAPNNYKVFLGIFEEKCDSLNANFVCRSDYIGCLCKRSPPAEWQEDQNGEYTCGWTGNQCLGTCPPTHPLCEEIDWVSGDTSCVCLTSDYEHVHPDWKPDGPNYDPHDDEIPNGDENGYIEGQIGTIFVTDLTWNGASGGLIGIDEKCQIHATSSLYAGMSGTWIAIAGDTSTNARSRVTTSGPFYRVDGVIIANSHADLFDGSIQNPININEYGALESGTAWTGSDGAGYYVSDNCHDWQWIAVSGYYGSISSTSSSWLHDDKADCGLGKHFYCVRVS